MVGDLGVFYQKRCLISPRRDDKKSLAWLRFADGHLEGGLEQMYVFFVREAFDRVLATFSSVGSLLSRPRSASDDGPSQSKDESSLKTVDLKLAGPLVHLAGSRTYAAASSASEWAGAPDLVERFDIEPHSDFSAKLANFIGLVLLCIDAKFCK